jgi:hypothetical protein
MLLLKPGCECCDRDLPPDSRDAMICSFECTFCAHCAVEKLPRARCVQLASWNGFRPPACGCSSRRAVRPPDLSP